MLVTLIPLDYIDDVWPEIEAFMEGAAKYTYGRFNAEDIKAVSGYSPTRTYFCVSCGGYHVTSNKAASYFESRDRLMVQAYDTHTQDKQKQLEAQAARMDLQMMEARRLKKYY